MPSSFAQYSALSASRISSSRPEPCIGYVATPALTVTGPTPSTSSPATRSTIERATAVACALVVAGEEHGELVAAEPERLAALPQARGDLAEHEVADRMAEAVVDALEVVDVDEAEGERRALVLGRRELALQPLVEAAVVAEPRERVGQGEPHRPQRLERRALVEGDREQRADERDRERGLRAARARRASAPPRP